MWHDGLPWVGDVPHVSRLLQYGLGWKFRLQGPGVDHDISTSECSMMDHVRVRSLLSSSFTANIRSYWYRHGPFAHAAPGF